MRMKRIRAVVGIILAVVLFVGMSRFAVHFLPESWWIPMTFAGIFVGTWLACKTKEYV